MSEIRQDSNTADTQSSEALNIRITDVPKSSPGSDMVEHYAMIYSVSCCAFSGILCFVLHVEFR